MLGSEPNGREWAARRQRERAERKLDEAETVIAGVAELLDAHARAAPELREQRTADLIEVSYKLINNHRRSALGERSGA